MTERVSIKDYLQNRFPFPSFGGDEAVMGNWLGTW